MTELPALDRSTPGATAEWAGVRQRVIEFVENECYPAEKEMKKSGDPRAVMKRLQDKAKAQGLWALGHPKEIGGQGMPFMDYVYVNEVVGRSELAMVALGTHTLQDSIMLHLYADPIWKERYLEPLVAGEIHPSFAMTEPNVSSSDPTQIETFAVQDGDDWVINGHKWFITGALTAEYCTVMCKTDNDAPPHKAFTMIIVPTNTPGFEIVRDVEVMGEKHNHCEIKLTDVRVPLTNTLGPRGEAFVISQRRLGPGRIFHCMRWLGQAQRAFDLMCNRLLERRAFGERLADKQLMQAHVFEAAAEIQANRLLTIDAARKMDMGSDARIEIALVKVTGARMVHDVIDRAIQVHGAKGVSEDTPLENMYRQARFARIYDGPDEVHMQSTGRRILREFEKGRGWDFGERDLMAYEASNH